VDTSRFSLGGGYEFLRIHAAEMAMDSAIVKGLEVFERVVGRQVATLLDLTEA
jgi:hypothetical protein